MIYLSLFISFIFAMSSSEPERNFSSLPTETTETLGTDSFLSATLNIRPRPNIPTQFSGAENRLCYNYANLLVRNGMVTATDAVLSDREQLLSSIYTYGRIILHHTATDQTPAQIINAAIRYNGWADVGYHFLISRDGTITEGRSLFYMGANAGQIPNRAEDCSNNMYYMDRDSDYRSIGIALIGNFDLYQPSSSQIDALKKLIQDLKERFKISEIKGHKHFKPTNCPGRYFMANHQSFFDNVSEAEAQNINQSTSPFINGRRDQRRNICYSCQ